MVTFLSEILDRTYRPFFRNYFMNTFDLTYDITQNQYELTTLAVGVGQKKKEK